MKRRYFAHIGLFLICLLLIPTTGSYSAPSLDDQYGFRTYWETHNGSQLFGEPITDVLEEDGRIVQYFTNVRFEYAPESATGIQLGLLGRERSVWRQFAPQPTVQGAALRFSETSYIIREPFRAFWETNGGLELFGLPISAALWERLPQGRVQVQYFERAKLVYQAVYAGTSQTITLAPLGREAAAARGLTSGSEVARGPVMYAYEPQTPAPTPTIVIPTPQPQPTAAPVQQPKPVATQQPTIAPQPTAAPVQQPSANKHITVNISQQWMYAYEGDTIVFDAPVTTGKDGFNTPAGDFAIYAKIPLQTMRGSLGGESWLVPDVPHAMYFTGGVALHGTYWHNLFGSGVRISHGCVNLPLDAAAWIYGWANVGTPVHVTY